MASRAFRDKFLRLNTKASSIIDSKSKSKKNRQKAGGPISTNVDCKNFTGETNPTCYSSDKEPGKSKHSCHLCGRSFSRSYDLRRHSLVHLNIEHFQTTHPFEGDNQNPENASLSCSFSPKTLVTFKCEVCSRIFKVKDSYERHKRIHTGERPFHCLECSKRFRDSGALSRHVKEVHAKIKNHPCNICNKWFVNRATLEDHFRTHTGERPYVCHQCGYMFKSKSALYQHSKTHSNFLPHICIICGKGFRRRQELIVHTPTHTNEKAHICEKCGKGFSTRSELQRHIFVHSDEKPFPCLVCGLNFSQKRYLRSHQKSRHSRADELLSPGLIPVESLEFT